MNENHGRIRGAVAKQWRKIEILAVLIGTIVAFKFMLWGILELKTAFGTQTCNGNLIWISQAALMYHQQQSSYPTRMIADDNGNPAHSWRVLLRDYLPIPEFRDYSFSEPWDGPNNRKLHRWQTSELNVSHCPKDRGSIYHTSYVGVAGLNTIFPPGKTIHHNEIQGTHYSETEDHISVITGASNTIFAVESHNSGIQLLEPRDLTIEVAMKGINQPPPSINSPHKRWLSEYHAESGAAAAFVDGKVRFLNSKIDPKILRSLLEIDNPDKPKEKYDPTQLLGSARYI